MRSLDKVRRRMIECDAGMIDDLENNGIAVHAWSEDHMVNWEEAKVRQLEPVMWKRKILEAIHIYNKKREQLTWSGTHLNPIWSPVMPGFEQ